jgi:hypothetical protein
MGGHHRPNEQLPPGNYSMNLQKFGPFILYSF